MDWNFTLVWLLHNCCWRSVIALVEQVIGRRCCRTDLAAMWRWLIWVYDIVGLVIDLTLVIVLLDHGAGSTFWHWLNKMHIAITPTQSLVVLIERSWLCYPFYLIHTCNDRLRSIIIPLWPLTWVNLMSLLKECLAELMVAHWRQAIVFTWLAQVGSISCLCLTLLLFVMN